MKHVLQLILIFIVLTFTFVECIPSSLCLYTACDNYPFDPRTTKCYRVAMFTRGKYNGKVQSSPNPNNNFDRGQCSGDGIFCVRTQRYNNDVTLTYANKEIRILGQSGHVTDANNSCRQFGGMEFWLDL